MKTKLHPGAMWHFRIKVYVAAIILLFFLSFLILPIIFRISSASAIAPGVAMVVVYFIIWIGIAEIYARMSYKRWFYEFDNDNLKIERGIIWKKYSNIPYARIQNIDIARGIIARMLGFSEVDIQTAGFSYTRRGMPSSEGHIPAVSFKEAEQIRKFLIKKISKRGRSQGL